MRNIQMSSDVLADSAWRSFRPGPCTLRGTRSDVLVRGFVVSCGLVCPLMALLMALLRCVLAFFRTAADRSRNPASLAEKCSGRSRTPRPRRRPTCGTTALCWHEFRDVAVPKLYGVERLMLPIGVALAEVGGSEFGRLLRA